MMDLQALLAKARTVRTAGAVPASVPSPCVSVCRMDAATRLCEGCLRTLDEITAWSALDDESRRDIWRLIERRAGVPQ